MGIKELARHLNISIGTVSRALNGHPEVNAETRRRVLEAARELGYAPDQAGRSLRQGTLNVVALLLSTDLSSKTDAMFFMELSRGIQDVLSRHDLDLVLHLNKPGLDMLDRVRRVVERRQADALILAETRDEDPRLDYLSSRNFPFATMGRSLSGGTHPWMDLDFDFAMRAVIDRLTGFGHRRIGLVIGSPGYMLDTMLTEAYRRELQQRGIAVDDRLICRVDTHEAGGYEAMTRFLALPEPPTAAIFPHYRAVVGAYSCLAEAGLSPGRDMAIVSCSADTTIAQFMAPPLTCFRLDLYSLGGRLAEALLASMPRFAEAYGGALIQELWPWELLGRESDAIHIGA